MIGTTLKSAMRSIRSSTGRYLALILIVLLSVACYAGLKLTEPDMHLTLERYAERQAMYDFRVVSTLGYDEENVAALAELPGVAAAEGSHAQDAVLSYEGKDHTYRLLSIPEEINQISLEAGRLPEAEDECVADADVFDEADIGKTIAWTDAGSADAGIAENRLTIVGLAESPLYVGPDRGTSTLGDGSIRGFLYLPARAFSSDSYTDVYLRLEDREAIYSDAYDRLTEDREDSIQEAAEEQAEQRYERLLAEQGLSEATAEALGIEHPETVLLTRDEDSGYVSFESDTAIVSAISAVFPLFFILVGMLVCLTTMSRMIIEERTQIGVLKALGMPPSAIVSKYLLYAGSAAVIGWAAGYLLGSRLFPEVFWYAYNTLYDFSELSYSYHPGVVFGTLAVSLLAMLGSAYYSCHRTLREKPAALLRPKSPEAGKRILLERWRALWQRLSFLHKVSLRNAFLSRRRAVMMLIGVSGCTALLVTAFGVRNSMMPIGELQYREVLRYDLAVTFAEAGSPAAEALLAETADIRAYILCTEERVEATAENTNAKRAVQLYSFRDEDTDAYFRLQQDGETLDFPGQGEVLLSREAAKTLGVSAGDEVTLTDGEGQEHVLTLAGVFDNYTRNYAVLSAETYTALYGEDWAPTGALLLAEDADTLSDELLESEDIQSVSLPAEMQETTDDMLACLDYIIVVIVLFAGALAFVVIYNLTNINLSERSREVATVKVLGFYPRETSAYILQENIVLSALAALLGLPLGFALHRFVFYKVNVDGVYFPIQIEPVSYGIALVLTMVFTGLVNLYMKRRAWNINMAESLKSGE